MRASLLALLLLVFCVGCSSGSTTHGASSTAVPAWTPTPTTSPIASAGNRSPSTNTEAAINAIIQHMSLADKVGQLFMIEFSGAFYTADLDAMVSNSHVGGMILYNMSARSMQQTRDVISAVQNHANLPLFVAVDQEGAVDRLAVYYGPAPVPLDMGARDDPAFTKQVGITTAKRLLDLGINTNFAPIADVQSVPNPSDGPRLWSTSPDVTIREAGAFLDGEQQGGVAGTLKHWPGIGSLTSDQDLHKTLAVVTHSPDQLQTLDFAPFQALLSHGPAMIMTTHAIVDALDPGVPTTLSHKLVTDVLRNQLGYQGCIVTDQLHMEAITDHYDLGESGVLAILAGNDVIEGPYNSYTTQYMITAVLNAIKSGRITEERINESVRRILRVKYGYEMGLDKLNAAAQR